MALLADHMWLWPWCFLGITEGMVCVFQVLPGGAECRVPEGGDAVAAAEPLCAGLPRGAVPQ